MKPSIKILFVEVFEHLYTNPIFALNEINGLKKKANLF